MKVPVGDFYDDFLFGGGGNDILAGGPGSDSCAPGGGTYQVNSC